MWLGFGARGEETESSSRAIILSDYPITFRLLTQPRVLNEELTIVVGNFLPCPEKNRRGLGGYIFYSVFMFYILSYFYVSRQRRKKLHHF